MDRVVRFNSIHLFVFQGLLEFVQDGVWLVLSFVFRNVGRSILKRHEFVFDQVWNIFLHDAAFWDLCSSGFPTFRPATALAEAIILNPKGSVALDYLGSICPNGTPICAEIIGGRKLPGDSIRGCPLDKRTSICRSRCYQRRELLSKRL